MAPPGYVQEMPPTGGYSGINWAKKPPVKRLGGKSIYHVFDLVDSMSI